MQAPDVWGLYHSMGGTAASLQQLSDSTHGARRPNASVGAADGAISPTSSMEPLGALIPSGPTHDA